eukprot:m.321554 g.321554  ORF g.321554 m.321554 type:complete len:269 (-) comp16000_c0_seq1:250-1056(-)
MMDRMTAAAIAVVAALVLVSPTMSASVGADSNYHNISINFNGTNDPCFMVSFKDLIFTDGSGMTINASEPGLTGTTSGSCDFLVLNKTSKQYEAHAKINATYVIDQTTFSFTIEMENNTKYNEKHEIVNNTDMSAALSAITVNVEAPKYKMLAVFTSFGWLDLAMDNGTSYACAQNISYTTNMTTPHLNSNASISFTGIQLEAFLNQPQTSFSPVDDDVYCPPDDAKIKKIGLVVGGTLSGLALLGIIIFTIGKCRGDGDGYETLDNI